MSAASITDGLAAQRVLVASGAAWDDDRHVRITLRDKPATERLAAALRAL
jgi:histidinol-phosphate/aromatic aminotransferase/cobyric acid decarboxylase-like protein